MQTNQSEFDKAAEILVLYRKNLQDEISMMSNENVKYKNIIKKNVEDIETRKAEQNKVDQALRHIAPDKV